jgi:hypothetical protein
MMIDIAIEEESPLALEEHSLTPEAFEVVLPVVPQEHTFRRPGDRRKSRARS